MYLVETLLLLTSKIMMVSVGSGVHESCEYLPYVFTTWCPHAITSISHSSSFIDRWHKLPTCLDLCISVLRALWEIYECNNWIVANVNFTYIHSYSRVLPGIYTFLALVFPFIQQLQVLRYIKACLRCTTHAFNHPIQS